MNNRPKKNNALEFCSPPARQEKVQSPAEIYSRRTFPCTSPASTLLNSASPQELLLHRQSSSSIDRASPSSSPSEASWTSAQGNEAVMACDEAVGILYSLQLSQRGLLDLLEDLLNSLAAVLRLSSDNHGYHLPKFQSLVIKSESANRRCDEVENAWYTAKPRIAGHILFSSFDLGWQDFSCKETLLLDCHRQKQRLPTEDASASTRISSARIDPDLLRQHQRQISPARINAGSPPPATPLQRQLHTPSWIYYARINAPDLDLFAAGKIIRRENKANPTST